MSDDGNRFTYEPGDISLIPPERLDVPPRLLWSAIKMVKEKDGANSIRELWLEGHYDYVRAELYSHGVMKRDGEIKAHIQKYDEDQPRDESGKWTSGGGSSGDNVAQGLLHEAASNGDARTAEQMIADSGPDTSQKLAEAEKRISQGTPTNALVINGGYKMADGNYTPDRKALHDAIITKFLNADTIAKARPKPGEKPLVTFLGGRGGSGKSFFTQAGGPVDKDKAIVIDPDEFKKELPEYKGWNASLVHEEAGELADSVTKKAKDLGLNIILDATLRSQNSSQRKMQEFKDAGYAVDGHYMFASPHTAAKRAIGRFLSSGRYVPVSYILGSTSNEKTFDTMRPGFRKWSVYSNDVDGQAPKKIKEGSNEAS